MKNPYSLLGIAQNADTQQLREAYQTLAGRHEGDERRMREINDAYEATLLARGGSDEAMALLECVPEDQRGSEWHYRMGCVQRERGWLEEAEARFRHAALFEPGNRKYQAALKQMQAGRSGKGGIYNGAVEGCKQSCGDCLGECACECCGESCDSAFDCLS